MNIKRTYLVAGLAMLGFGLMLGYAFYQLIRVERSLANYVGENMLWAINQADRETRRFNDTLLLDNTDEATVLLRLDILRSRLDLLDEGPQLEYFTSIGVLDELKHIIETMNHALTRFDQGKALRRSDVFEYYKEVQPVFLNFGRIANLSMIHERDVGGANRDRQLRIIYLTMGAVIGLMTVGGILSVLLVLNINSANRANQELRRYQEELEGIVEQRTQALTVALKSEQKSNEIYKGFLTTVSHQFKTPVAIIDLIAQRFIRHPDDISTVAITEAALRIRDTVSRLNRIIESTISGDIIETDGLKNKSSIFDLVEVVSRTIDYHRDFYSQRFVEFKQQVEEFRFFGEKTLIEQIIVNLLANADKYSLENRNIVVTVLLDGNDFVCRVRDFGIGIPVSEAGKIFNRFYRASNVAHLSGSGLGLSSSRQIAEMHGGHLNLLLSDETYTEFELRLPAVGDDN